MSRSEPGRVGRALLVGVLAVVLAATSACGGSRAGSAALPGLKVRAINGDGSGTDTTLAASAGQPMVVNLWAPWCPPCRTEMPDFDTVATKYPDVTFVGVATGTEEAAARAFAEQVGVHYSLVYDVADVALDELRVSGLPATLFVDASGRVVATHQGALSAAELEAQLAKSFPS